MGRRGVSGRVAILRARGNGGGHASREPPLSTADSPLAAHASSIHTLDRASDRARDTLDSTAATPPGTPGLALTQLLVWKRLETTVNLQTKNSPSRRLEPLEIGECYDLPSPEHPVSHSSYAVSARQGRPHPGVQLAEVGLPARLGAPRVPRGRACAGFVNCGP